MAMKLPRLLRSAATAAAVIAGGVILFDAAAYFLFPGVVQRIAPEFANDVGPEIWRENRVGHYYRRSETRGFDIAPGARSVSWDPPDVAPYPIWGNSVGCFDDEPPAATAPAIYLAGDSFTWGYAPYDTKFGTVIERRTGLLVYACGVTNTGTRHQFDKFLEVAKSFPGWPALVIVNVFTNDIADDFAFPHTTVVDGAWVEDAHLERHDGELSVRRAAPEREIPGSGDLKYYLKTYSATANIVVALKRAIDRSLAPAQHAVSALYRKGTFPIQADFAAPHRQAVKRWLKHAADNGYAIRFALIPDGDQVGTDIYQEYKQFIREAGGTPWDFGGYLTKNGLSRDKLYWPYNGHFTPAGNAVYAEFLTTLMKAEGEMDMLPPRFADISVIAAPRNRP